MAGGDLLYIFAFIILPTAVLVSCIWALIMLRNGRLLPKRPVPRQYERAESMDDELDGERDLIEETGEHIIIEPGQPVEPVVVAPAATTTPPAPEVRPDPLPEPIVAEAPDVPIVEQTQELSAVPVEATVDDAPVEATELPDASPPVAEDAEVLIVPLEEPTPPYVNGQSEPPVADTLESAADEVAPVTAAAPEQPRPARRPVRLHPGQPDPARPRPRIGQRKTTRRDGS